MKKAIKEYILDLLHDQTMHQSSCAFPETDCTCLRPDDIGYDSSLLRGGFVDSFMVETIVVFISVKFNVIIPDIEVVESNFDTINKMVALINKLNCGGK